MRSTTQKRGPQLSERVLQMKQNFMSLHLQGYSIPAIAERFQIDKSTVYFHLQDIADENHTSRQSLLKIVRTDSKSYLRQEETAFRVDSDELMQEFARAKNSISTLMEKIGETIKTADSNEETEEVEH